MHSERQSIGLQVERSRAPTYSLGEHSSTRGTVGVASTNSADLNMEVECLRMCNRFAECSFISVGEVERCMHNCASLPNSDITLDLDRSCDDLTSQMRSVR